MSCLSVFTTTLYMYVLLKGVRDIKLHAQMNDIPTTLIVAKETTVEIEVLNRLVLEHVTVLPFIAAVMFTVKLEDRQYVASDAGPLEAV